MIQSIPQGSSMASEQKNRGTSLLYSLSQTSSETPHYQDDGMEIREGGAGKGDSAAWHEDHAQEKEQDGGSLLSARSGSRDCASSCI